jgi:hypothetical protein
MWLVVTGKWRSSCSVAGTSESFAVVAADSGGGGDGSLGLWPGPLGTFLSTENWSSTAICGGGGGGWLITGGRRTGGRGTKFINLRWLVVTGKWRAASAVGGLVSITSGRSTSTAAVAAATGDATFLVAAIAIGWLLSSTNTTPLCCEYRSYLALIFIGQSIASAVPANGRFGRQ